MPPSVIFSLFDKIVVPILCYGAEVWGYELRERIERVHMKFCKPVLGVAHSTSNAAVLGECRPYPLCVVYYRKCVTFWLKILSMNEPRLTKDCYMECKYLDLNGRQTWCTKIKDLLSRYGYADVWLNQGVANVVLYTKSERLLLSRMT